MKRQQATMQLYNQAGVNPMVDLNLHFTGDIHAITTANKKSIPDSSAFKLTRRFGN